MQDSSVNHLPLNTTLCIKRNIPFIEINDKGGEIETKIWQLGDLDMDNGQRGSDIEESRRIKILRQEKHTSRGSKLMNFD